MLKNFSLLLPFSVSLFWTMLFLFSRKTNTRAQNIWTIAIMLITITSSVSAFYWHVDGNYSIFYKLDIIETFSTLLFVPVVFLYFRELTGDKRKPKLTKCLLFIPPLLFAGINAFALIFIGDEHATSLIKSLMETNEISSAEYHPLLRLHVIINDYTYSLILLLQSLVVVVYAAFRLVSYRKHLNNFFADIEDKDIERHWAVFWALLVFLILTFVAAASGYLLFNIQHGYNTLTSIFLISYSASIYYISYTISRSRYSSEKLALETNSMNDKLDEVEISDNGNELKDEETEIKNSIHLKFLPKFNQVIDEDKIFLQKNLRLDDVAFLVFTNRTYISRILKDVYHCSFWEFINRKRVEYAKEMVRQNPELTSGELAEICGFSHGSTFSRAFKQCEGITFKDWLKKLS